MVYVLNMDGRPLMPTTRHGKVRWLLKNNQAKVVKKSPFTIQLLYATKEYTQPITLGVDAGSKHIGISASTNKKEVYTADIELRNDIVELLATRREMRKTRRNRKTRYRAPRFDNRISSKKEGWLAPSIRQKIETHLQVIERIHKILPISKIIIEVASFDMQKLKDDSINGIEYQNGEQTGFWNVREYVLHRDNHECQCCHGKSKDRILNVHHIESRKTGGNAPGNLITLCKTCHDAYHDGKIKKEFKRQESYRDSAFMGIMRWALYNKLKETYPDVEATYGYMTKHKRIEKGLEKEHYNDAYCIASNLEAKPLETYIYQRKVRCHNRQIHKFNLLKGGSRKLNQAPYLVKGYRLFDKVRFQKQECFIFGRRSSGYFDIRRLDGTKVSAGIGYKKLELLEARKSILSEDRSRQFLSNL